MPAKRPTRLQRMDAIFARLYPLYHGKDAPSPEIKRLYWLLAERTGTNPPSHATLDAIASALAAETQD